MKLILTNNQLLNIQNFNMNVVNQTYSSSDRSNNSFLIIYITNQTSTHSTFQNIYIATN